MATDYPIEITDPDGSVRIAGLADFTDPDNQPGLSPVDGVLTIPAEVVIDPPGDGDADIQSLTIEQPSDFDEWKPFRVLAADASVLASIADDGTIGAAGLGVGSDAGTFAVIDQGAPAGIFLQVVGGSQVLQSPLDNTNSYIMVVQSGGYTDGSIGPYDAWGLKPQGQEYLTGSVPTPGDADVLTGERWQWYDATSGAPKLLIKERDADGALFDRISAVLTSDATAFAGVTKPVVPATPLPQDIVDALVTLGLVTQAT